MHGDHLLQPSYFVREGTAAQTGSGVESRLEFWLPTTRPGTFLSLFTHSGWAHCKEWAEGCGGGSGQLGLKRAWNHLGTWRHREPGDLLSLTRADFSGLSPPGAGLVPHPCCLCFPWTPPFCSSAIVAGFVC